MSYALSSTLSALALLLGMLLLLEAGRRIGARQRRADPSGAAAGTGALEGAVFALLGLLIAFTFSGASARLDARRSLIVEETNATGTAYQRIDLLPAAAQEPMRELFRRYLDARLETYRRLPDIDAATASLAVAVQMQREIWRGSVVACQATAGPQCATLLLPALNEMFDVATTRTVAARTHPPAVIVYMLFGLALTSALLAGYGMASARQRSWLHMLGFAATVAAAVYVILDLEYPRLGVLRVDMFDQALVDLRASMGGTAQ